MAAVWYQLVANTYGERYKNCHVEAVSITRPAPVWQFRKAVYAENRPALGGMVASELVVYASLDDLVNKKQLEEDDELGELGKTRKQPLFVLVPSMLQVSQDFSSAPKQNRIRTLKNLLFYTLFHINGQNHMGCVTAYNKRRLATFAHGFHQSLGKGDTIIVYSVVNNTPYQAKVFEVDQKRDYILLECDNDLCSITFGRAAPFEGEEYIQLGLSATSQAQSPFSVSRGVFTSTQFSNVGHYLGSAGSNPGESGGGCFAEQFNTLYGINVGCENVAISGNTTLQQLGTRYPARAHIVPSVFFD